MVHGTPEMTAELFAAIAKVTARATNTISSQSATGGTGGMYCYTPLHELTNMLRSILTDEGLAVVQTAVQLPNGDAALRGVLTHRAGGYLVTDTPLNMDGLNGTAMQQLGAATTYARRYQLAGMFLVAATEDTDAVGNNAASLPQSTASQTNCSPKRRDASPSSLVNLTAEEQLQKIRTCTDLALLKAMRGNPLPPSVDAAVAARMVELAGA